MSSAIDHVNGAAEASAETRADNTVITGKAPDSAAAANLAAITYQELRRIAQIHFAGERAGHTLQRTALVSEAYLRIAQSHADIPTNRIEFVRLASRVMRNILVDHARTKSTQKRGGDVDILSLDRTVQFYSTQLVAELSNRHNADAAEATNAFTRELDFIALDSAIEKLAALNERQAKVVELKFFAEQSIEDIAAVLGTSTATVKRDWAVARLFLLRELNAEKTTGA
jgi:RNA polymerase sigma-70 factor, ECF subfamily